MTSPDAMSAQDWTKLTSQIIEDAQITLQSPFLILTRYNRERQTSQQVGWGGLHSQSVQRTLALIRRLLNGHDSIGIEVPIANNPYIRAVYLERRHEIVLAPIHQLIEGAAPPLVAYLAKRVVGITHALVIPLLVEDEAIGTITCFQSHADFSPERRAIAQAFARQVALSIHNAQLVAQQRAAAVALEQQRQLLIQAQDHTRQEISELLHSRVQSRLLVAWHQLADVRGLDPDSRARLNTVRDGLEQLREQEVRQLSHHLHPEGLQAGLIPAVQMLASTLQGGLSVQLAVNAALVDADQPGSMGLPMAAKLVVFRAVEEALGNVLKHARVTEADVRLELLGGRLQATVTDHGVGFTLQQMRSGLGMRLLSARIEAAGGQWRLDSQRGGPTCLWLQVTIAGIEPY